MRGVPILNTPDRAGSEPASGTHQPPAADRTPRHIVAVTGVIWDAAGRLLLVNTDRRAWEPPGGRGELGEDLSTALHREILEETGCTVQVEPLLGVYSNLTTSIVLFMFHCTYTGGDPRPSDETPELGWYSAAEAHDLVTFSPGVDRLRDALAPDPRIIYRAYTMNPYRVVHEARGI